ncbi:MAG: hypothetical protein SFW09_22610, partial [Hyphomicrobiaceae bacterium]|nr:hypothetical protein [Hyphomicrobiaceae bacterium]
VVVSFHLYALLAILPMAVLTALLLRVLVGRHWAASTLAAPAFVLTLLVGASFLAGLVLTGVMLATARVEGLTGIKVFADLASLGVRIVPHEPFKATTTLAIGAAFALWIAWPSRRA